MLKDNTEFYNQLIKSFSYKPTSSQEELFLKLTDFILSTNNNLLFLIKGYAGTGKTSIISAVVTNLWKVHKKSVLLAPTGRAAKVISNYSKRQAQTIHKKIYHPRKDKSGNVSFVLQTN